MGFFQSPLFKKPPYKARHTIFFIWLKCYFRCFLSPLAILRGNDIMQRSIICHAVAWCDEVVLCSNTSTPERNLSLRDLPSPDCTDLSHERLGSFKNNLPPCGRGRHSWMRSHIKPFQTVEQSFFVA
jgi:hypothetical protein